MKKTILSSLILGAVFATSPLYAGIPTTTIMPQTTPCFDGFYIGISIDAVAPQEKITNEASFTPSANTTTVDSAELISKDSGAYNAGGSLFAGFGKTFDSQTYLGLEIFGHYYAAKTRIQDQSTIDTDSMTSDIYVKNLYSYGLDLRGGYLITPQTMFYILFGAEMGRFDIKSEVSDTFLAASVVNKFNKSRIGYTPGLGFETFMNQNLSLRAQYAYTFYNSFQRTDPSTPKGGTTVAEITTKIEPNRSMFSLMLSYYFG